MFERIVKAILKLINNESQLVRVKIPVRDRRPWEK